MIVTKKGKWCFIIIVNIVELNELLNKTLDSVCLTFKVLVLSTDSMCTGCLIL